MKTAKRCQADTRCGSRIAFTGGLLGIFMLLGCTDAPGPQAQRTSQPDTAPAAGADAGPEATASPQPRSSGESKRGFVGDIEQLTTENSDFRRVVYTGEHLQLVLMSLAPGEEIGEEVHAGIDQFLRIEQGRGQAIINGIRHDIEDDDSIVVPAGARHNVINTGDGPLRLYTIYGPPEHRDGVVRATRAEAMATDDHFDGKATE